MQERHWSIPKFLDRTLMLINNMNGEKIYDKDYFYFIVYKSLFPNSNYTEDSKGLDQGDTTLIRSFVEKLELDKYIIKDEYTASFSYVLTFDGMNKMLSARWPYRYQPYQYQLLRDNLRLIWQILGILAAILNAIAIIILTYLQVKGK